jgi:hypothetical protein
MEGWQLEADAYSRTTFELNPSRSRATRPFRSCGCYGIYAQQRGAQYMLQEFNIRNRDPPWDANSD